MGKFHQCLTLLSARDTIIAGYYSLTFLIAFMQLFLKLYSGMANSVDPDLTAPSGAV